MKHFSRGWGSALVICAVIGFSAVVHARRSAPIVREADIEGRACLALEDVALAMDGQLEWDAGAKNVDFTFRSNKIQFSIDSGKVVVNGEASSLESPVIKDRRATWVPRSFFTSGPLTRDFQKRINLEPVAAAVKPAVVTPPPAPPVAKPVLAPVVIPSTAAKTEAAEPVLPEPKRHAIRRIVIDPGHGGKDPGALGAHGTEEKNVNLWMARELADALREKDFEVLLTRTDDTFVTLSARSALANRYKADLFISVHCNASLSAKLNGFEVYFLSEKASNPHAEAVARLENASLEFEGKKPPTEVQAVLQSLAKNANINSAAQLGSIIDRQVAKQLAQADLGVKQAAFYVLRGAQMPAVLIELGFLTNPKEEKQLEDPKHRQRLIRAIEDSILEFDLKQQANWKKG